MAYLTDDAMIQKLRRTQPPVKDVQVMGHLEAVIWMTMKAVRENDAARAAAQADYEARILSAIDTTAVDAELAALRSQVSALTEDRDRLREAAENGLSFAESWVKDNGGTDGCEMQDRLGLELIRSALSPKPEGA